MPSTPSLSDYRPIHLPDLSNSRRSPHDPHVNTLVHELEIKDSIGIHVDDVKLDALVLIAYANILGLYCGATDVLLSLQNVDGDSSPFRLKWDETTTWLDALEVASIALEQTGRQLASVIGTTSQPVGIVEDHPPYIAVFRDSSRSGSCLASASSVIPSRVLLLTHTGSGLLHLHSTSNRFSSSTASMLLRQIAGVVAHILANATQKIVAPLHLNNDLASVIEALPEHERATYYSHISPARLATDYILSHSISRPDAPAVHWHPVLSPDMAVHLTPECLSYNDLDRGANRFARFLLNNGLSSEDRVAVCMDRDPMFHVVLFGILRAGGCYVPIDPELPTQRKLFIARNSSARFVIISSCSNELCDIFGDLAIDISDMSVQKTVSVMNDAQVNVAFPGNTAYMIYTSGTTGNPKGCLITHNGLSEAILALSSFPADVKMTDIRKGKYLAVASIAFDVHLSEIFVPLALGMTLISVKRGELLENLSLYINALGITHIGLVPSLIDATLCAIEDDRKGEEMTLRYIASGGEKISDAILDKWTNHQFVRLANFYGPSEVTIGCCARFMDSNIPTGNVGPPFSNVSSYVVDDNLNILPRGAIGELVVAGPLVGRGYHELPDLTAKFFMQWPCPGSWSYRTGDLVRMLPDGTLHVIGRADTQIKLRGIRIEAEGISSVFRNAALSELGLHMSVGTVLAAHPAIGGGATPQLVSFVAWDMQVPIALRRTIRPNIVPLESKVFRVFQTVSRQELASYMRPAHIFRLSWLPLSPNGKADDKVLATIFRDIDLRELTRTIHGPSVEKCSFLSTDIEQELVSLVERHFETSPINLQMSIFAYGADSLSLVKLVSDIRRTFHVSVSVADVMKAAIIASIGELIQTRPSLRSAPNRVTRRFSEQWLRIAKQSVNSQVECVLPSFPIQEGVLYHSDSHPTSSVQHVVMSISEIPLSRVRDAWESTMKKLDILRTVFYFGKQLVQVVLAPTTSQLPWIERWTPLKDANSLCSFFFAELAPSLARQINETISTTPLFRLIVFSTSEDSHRYWLTLSIHHALFDGVSLPLILKFVENELLQRPHTVACSAESLLEHMHSADTDSAREFWATKFSDFVWSTHRLTKSVRLSSQLQRKTMPLTISLTGLGKLVAPRQVTIQSVLTCTFALCLARYVYHTNDVAFVVIRAGRLLPVEGAERGIYPTINVLPARVRFDTKGYLHRVQEDISAAVAFEHFPLSHVQKWLPPGTGPFDTLFAITVQDDTQYEVWNILRSELPEPDFPLSTEVLLDRDHNTLSIRAAYYDCESLATNVDEIFNRFEAILLKILKGENDYISSFPQSAREMNFISDIAKNDGDQEKELGEGSDQDVLEPLREIVSDFFGFPSHQLHETTSLFSLGLDSIRSVGLSRILRQHGYSTNAADIMENTTLRKLATLCSRSLGQSAHTDSIDSEKSVLFLQKLCEKIKISIDPSICKLSIDDDIEIFPTTALQAGMISQTVASTGNLYFHSFVLALHSDIDLPLLQSAWIHAINNLDILRTSFHYVAELASWVQVCHSVVKLDWQECIPPPSVSLQYTIDELCSRLKPTDESAFRSPPIHLRILHSNLGLYLVLFMHHALYDGLSISCLLSHVAQIYEGRKFTRPAQFFDFISHMLFQQDHAASYWIEKLHCYHPIALPRNRSLLSKGIVASRMVSIRQESLMHLVRKYAVTLQCLGQAVWAKYLASLVSSNDVVFGHVVSGRSFDDSDKVVGPMFNTIPCRVQFSPQMNNLELLRSIHRNNVNGLPWQHVSLRVVQKKLALHDLLSSLFLFQPWNPNADSRLWTVQEQQESETEPLIQYPLNFEFHQVETGFLIKMACMSDVMDAEALNDALDNINMLLNEMVDHLEGLAISNSLTRADGNIALANITKPALQPADATHIHPKLLTALSSVVNCSVEEISPSHSLVAIGVDSITAISLGAKCKKAGLMVSIGDIVSSFTVGELAEKITGTHLDTTRLQVDSSLPPISTEEQQAIVKRFPERCRGQITSISPATEGIKWFIAAWRCLRRGFHHVFAYKLNHDVHVQHLRETWKALVAHHPILRSTFASAPGYADPRVVTFAINSMEADLAEEHMEYGQDLPSLVEKMQALVMSPLPLSVAQAKGLILTSTSTSNRYLLIQMHHFQYDAFSLQLLLEDLSSMYLGLSPRNTGDSSEFLATFSPSSANLSKQRSYWQSAVPLPLIPTHFPPITPRGSQSSSPERFLETITSAIRGATKLKKQAQAFGIPLHCVLLASWASVQAFHASSDQATFGLWHAGRTGSVPNILNLAIPCMNVLPIHVTVADNLIKTARNIQQDLYKRTAVIQQSSLRNIDEWVTGGNGLPLSNVFVNVLEIAAEEQRENKSKLFSLVEVDYSIPPKPLVSEDRELIDALPTSKLIQIDVMIDIVINEKQDVITMSIESERAIMDVVCAREIIDIWAKRVKDSLSDS